MSAPTKLAGFVVALLAVFAAATGVGAALGPDAVATRAPASSHMSGSGAGPMAEHVPGGLMVSDDGYTLRLAKTIVSAGPDAAVHFRILGPNGQAVTEYQRSHEKDLHLIVVRRDLTDFQHVHPRLSADGTWSVPVDLSEAGDYRVFADFVPAARGANGGLTLGADLAVAGNYRPRALPAESTTTHVDGYDVTLDGNLTPGRESTLTLSVARHGTPVTDLQPYLGAYGHLVALRAGDLAYLHVHPDGEPGDGRTAAGPDVTFTATAPTAGTYRLFLDFRHQGQVHTASFTVVASGTEKETPDGQNSVH